MQSCTLQEQLFFDLLTRGDIAGGDQPPDSLPTPVVERRNLQVESLHRCPFAQDDLRLNLAHAPEALDQIGPGAEKLRSQMAKRIFVRECANQPPRRRVEVHDAALLVQHEHGVAHLIDHQVPGHWRQVEQPIVKEVPGQRQPGQSESKWRQIERAEAGEKGQPGDPGRERAEDQHNSLAAI